MVARRLRLVGSATASSELGGLPLRSCAVPWSSVVLALLIGIPLSYWTVRLNENGFELLSLIPGVFGFLMVFGALGMLFGSQESTPEAA